jgi:hypothetical protein
MATISVIGLVGQAGSGKSEVAQHLVANHGYVRVKFAGILKDMCRVLGLTEREIEGDFKEVPSGLLLGHTPRYAMQTLGTEWGRDLIHPNLWAHAWKVRVAEELEKGNKVVADDCRFFNEAGVIYSFHPSEIWSIRRDNLPDRMRHKSEQEYNNIAVHRKLRNSGSIGDLKTAVDGMIASYDPTH